MKARSLGVLLLLLGGCVSLPEQAEPEKPDLPDRWQTVNSGSAVRADWLTDFEDARLRELVAEAMEANHNLRATAQRMLAAREQAVVAGADRLPDLSANASASRAKRNLAGSALPTGGGLVSSTNNTFAPSLDLRWELDLWGRLGDAERAAIEDARAAELALEAARMSLAARVCEAYFALIAAEHQLELAQETFENYSHATEVIESRYHNGTGEALDLRLARSNRESVRATLALRARQQDAAVRRLELLLGRYPEDVLRIEGRLPETLPEVPAGIPSELLNRRPSLARARAELEAAYARANEARKLALPSIGLTGSFGTSSSELENVLDGDYSVWSLAGNLTQPLFQAGRIEANARRAKASWMAQWEQYRALMLEAFGEVETALAAERYLQERREALQAAAREAEQAEELAWERYQRGLTDIVTVLETQRRAFNARVESLDAAFSRIQNRINLHLALGGDFIDETN